MKIYWDQENRQFRHRYTCEVCGEPYECYCYDHLEDAISEVKAGFYCFKHYLLKYWNEDENGESVSSKMDKIRPDLHFGDRFEKMQELLDDDLDERWDRYRESRQNQGYAIEKELTKILDSLDKEVFELKYCFDCDWETEGSYCEI